MSDAQLTVRAASRKRDDLRVGAADLEDALLAVLRALRAGEVTTYGEVADDAGYPGRARAVGRLLATTTAELPWWRVVTASGRLVPGHEAEHAARLRGEGVQVRDGHVVRLRP